MGVGSFFRWGASFLSGMGTPGGISFDGGPSKKIVGWGRKGVPPCPLPPACPLWETLVVIEKIDEIVIITAIDDRLISFQF